MHFNAAKKDFASRLCRCCRRHSQDFMRTPHFAHRASRDGAPYARGVIVSQKIAIMLITHYARGTQPPDGAANPVDGQHIAHQDVVSFSDGIIGAHTAA